LKSFSTRTILLVVALVGVAGTALWAQPLENAQAEALENFWGNSANWSQQQIY